MRLPHQVIESIKGAMQPLVRQHPIQTRNCEQDEEQQNEDGDNNLHERETALMPHCLLSRFSSGRASLPKARPIRSRQIPVPPSLRSISVSLFSARDWNAFSSSLPSPPV